jgi:ribosome-associated protein
MDDLVVGPTLTIPAAELVWRFSRSGGPGGQHVNTSATRVELSWNVRTSAAPSPAQRGRLLAALAARLDAQGALRVVADQRRSQHENRELARAGLRALLAAALKPRRVRLPTHPTAGSSERRLEGKRRRALIKQQRRKPEWP